MPAAPPADPGVGKPVTSRQDKPLPNTHDFATTSHMRLGRRPRPGLHRPRMVRWAEDSDVGTWHSPNDSSARPSRVGGSPRCPRAGTPSRGADEEAQRALRLGTRLTCLSAARVHGAWVPLDSHRPPRPHVAVRHGDPLPARAGVVVHRLPTAGWTTNEPVLPLDRSLDQVLRFHSVETGGLLRSVGVSRPFLVP